LRLRNASLAGAVLFLSLTNCQTYTVLPVTQTDGSYLRLPESSTKAVVWGTHPEAVRSLKTWLLKRGFIVVDDVKMSQIANEINLHLPVSNAEVLRLAKIAGTKEVIFVDADISSWQASEILTIFGQNPNVYKASLFIRALDTETGQIDWNGKALSLDKFSDLTAGIHQLTCQALATAWGLREPGIAANTTICPQGQNVMVQNESSPRFNSAVKPSENGELGARRTD
jgi:hypothetical protein